MRFVCATAMVLASAVVVPVWAQPAPDSDAGRCAALVAAIGDGLPFKAPPTVTASGPNSCTLGPLRIDFMRAFGVEIEGALIEGLTPAPDAPAPPGGKVLRRIELHDTRQITPMARPGIIWMQHASQTPLLVVLSSSEDTGARTMDVSLTVSGKYYGEVTHAASFTGVGPDTEPFGLPEMQAGALNAFTLHWDSQLMLLRFAVPYLAGTLGDKPDEEVAADKQRAEQQMRATLAQLPGVAPGTADALAAFIKDFPRPAKVLDVGIDLSAHPLSAGDVDAATGGPDGAMALAKQYKLKATYGGDAQ